MAHSEDAARGPGARTRHEGLTEPLDCGRGEMRLELVPVPITDVDRAKAMSFVARDSLSRR
jgi:hypothetical protein